MHVGKQQETGVEKVLENSKRSQEVKWRPMHSPMMEMEHWEDGQTFAVNV